MPEPYLEIANADGRRQVPVTDKPVTVGRHSSNLVVVMDGQASRYHCVIERTSDGFRVRDPATDLAVLCALASAVRDVPLPSSTAFIGEVALSGAIRTVPAAARRVSELSRSGVQRCYVPPGLEPVPGIELVCVETVAEALQVALRAGPRTADTPGDA